MAVVQNLERVVDNLSLSQKLVGRCNKGTSPVRIKGRKTVGWCLHIKYICAYINNKTKTKSLF